MFRVKDFGRVERLASMMLGESTVFCAYLISIFKFQVSDPSLAKIKIVMLCVIMTKGCFSSLSPLANP